MSSVLTRCRVSDEQIDLLLSFMEDYPDFAAGKPSIYSRFSSSKLWRLLAERLNAAAADSGGSRKSPDKWCRYWADLKYRTRKKAAGCGVLGDLTRAEERLHNIFVHSGRDCEWALCCFYYTFNSRITHQCFCDSSLQKQKHLWKDMNRVLRF
ncbi:hypothetical protein K1T71_006392 [Dendrolimus kikuchii]|uniref:Uncharacterized protein n=1 Tax=Dendrolimus kikuchii TaxID=765133 RepID=A0ACC1D4B7_9NEOP|nr:hypothetical protein K1T71_006392 [Dendrolimus kikuchii]